MLTGVSLPVVDAVAGFAEAALQGGLSMAPAALMVLLGCGSWWRFWLAGKDDGDKGLELSELFLDGSWLRGLERLGFLGLQ